MQCGTAIYRPAKGGFMKKRFFLCFISLILVVTSIGAVSYADVDEEVEDTRQEVYIRGTETTDAEVSPIASNLGVFTTTGGWFKSGVPTADYEEVKQGDISAGSAAFNGLSGTAEWTPDLGVLNGMYEVYIYNVRRSDTHAAWDTNVKVEVRYTENGESKIYETSLNQKTASGDMSGWVKICTVNFEGNGEEKVVLTRETTNGGVYTQAKDVKFVPYVVEALPDVGIESIDFVDESDNIISRISDADKISVKIDVVSNVDEGDDPASLVAVAALYDNNNSMIAAKEIRKNVPAGYSDTISLDMDFSQYADTEGYRLSVYVWNNYKDMKPWFETQSIQ